MKLPSNHSRAGFSLVEVALALGVAAFCLVPVFGLLPVGLNSNRNTFEQTSAANVASAIVTDLRATALVSPPMDQTTPSYGVTIPGAPTSSSPVTFFVRQDGTRLGAVGANADPTLFPHYRVTIYFTSTNPAAAASDPNNATAARILITWPALADGSAAAVPTNFSGSLQATTALFRN
jgi:uncharacterized protein (TIGR02598 family)